MLAPETGVAKLQGDAHDRQSTGHRAARPNTGADGNAGRDNDFGVDGDHRGQLRHRQVTVITREGWEAACAELGQQLPWTTRRANILVEGLALAEATGRTIRIGEVALTITGETDPCSRMEEQVPGLRDALTPEWRGGVTCDVAHGGEVAVGHGALLEG